MKILFTCFEPFGGDGENASQKALEAAGFEYLLLKVEYDASIEALRQLDVSGFDAIVATGQCGGDTVRIERTAKNVDYSHAPDNIGVVRSGKIFDGSEDEIPSSLPCERIFDVLSSSNIPVRFSDDAGGYVCNHVFYALRHLFPEKTGGFIHIPKDMDTETSSRAVRHIAEVLS